MQQPHLENASTTANAPVSSKVLDEHSMSIFEELVDDVILGTCFEVHRSVKLGILFLDEATDDEKKYEIVDEVGLDVFGQVPLKKQFECVCPNCQRNLAASRFAPHLEKCMGMGRNSSRIASKRIANTGRAESDVDDYDNDSDWNYLSDRKPAKKRKDKNCTRRIKGKPKNGEQASTSSASGEPSNNISTYESLSMEERKALLTQMCGVISEHTKKMCTRSQRCPQHTDEQRKAVRQFLLNQGTGSSTLSADTGDEVHIDVDTFDEADNHALHDTIGQMWESVSSANSSPADGSFQSNNGAVGKKKDKRLQPFGSSAKKPNKSRPSSSGPSSVAADPMSSDLL
ncbi:ataxin-7-like protein 3 isoform X1 [Dermacentor andersoni]|uniref:ataxin-7-like protein 3 isoform X1 n=1 Tax=Dermacentor andersoni TaxID=34620 RepID=UPI0021553D00|nr:ataxin-7-like protein 3 isoform X1 [Dermacentor andersoni]